MTCEFWCQYQKLLTSLGSVLTQMRSRIFTSHVLKLPKKWSLSKLPECASCQLKTTSSPHFPSGIVERAKREGTWKSPNARKARRGGEREKWGTTDKTLTFGPSLPTDFGALSLYPLPNQLSASNGIPSLIELSLLLSLVLKLRGIFSRSKRKPRC